MLLLDKEDKGVAKCDTLVLNILMLILYISKSLVMMLKYLVLNILMLILYFKSEWRFSIELPIWVFLFKREKYVFKDEL